MGGRSVNSGKHGLYCPRRTRESHYEDTEIFSEISDYVLSFTALAGGKRRKINALKKRNIKLYEQ